MRSGHLAVEVKMEQSQGSVTSMRSPFGDYAKTQKNRRTLLVTLRKLGYVNPAVNVYAFFIANDASNRISGIYSASSASTDVQAGAGTVLEIDSAVIVNDRQRLFEFSFVSGDRPRGWVVLVFQDGTKLKELGSAPELTQWFWKNFPKKEVAKLR